VTAARFITDTSLEFLARRLRILGFDVETVRGAGLEALYERARRDARTVLTLSRRVPRRFADVPAIPIPRDAPMRAVRELAEAFEGAGRPFTRCAMCNHTLEPRPAAEAAGAVPERVRAGSKVLNFCAGCGRWYWPGTHVERLRAWLERALGHAVPGPSSAATRGGDGAQC
jgi:uncharacterized protein with PIN domain